MLNLFLDSTWANGVALAGILVAFLVTFLVLKKGNGFLPKDQGREFAHDGKLSEGKPRGAGFVFIIVFAVVTILFGKFSIETIIYMLLVVAAMITGYLDDCAKTPWGEYIKGFLDFVIAVVTAITFINFNGSDVTFAFFGTTITFNPIVYGILAVVLIWVSINVTNCTDGVDGLSGTIAIISLATISVVNSIQGNGQSFNYVIFILCAAILAYLWFNANPSKLMMGDAGSRAIGLFIAIAILKTGSPFLYIPICIVFIIDGGLGLIKVALLRFLKIHILKNTRTPIHDHVRKTIGWSNTQTVSRFAILQLVASVIVVYLLLV
ncbi:phospho-N-acetylmuramoyl-pentapeptide-transferase [Paludicola sp. MB14-C6]|uniref:phospho-N-acetylmuramoyl-pentapeptide- transferase n=1 Tax=Paludihabitans sp. MB14-C6 TaxID=3070656 RepID=UPI0027DB3FDA|nr:phospho-N-acetylmuramoyl-pentapeptide-transferase [Paludicola sp. MB14-C6]WMJ23981.1 phospho-N-acetylmuramoyl-pentapeptide-transferase [Paludicola sp. MB14-C6]